MLSLARILPSSFLNLAKKKSQFVDTRKLSLAIKFTLKNVV